MTRRIRLDGSLLPRGGGDDQSEWRLDEIVNIEEIVDASSAQ
jgi:hypothetical protein